MARKTDGSWSHDVDRLVELSGRSPVVLTAARLMFPAIPGEVLEHIFSERKRKREQMTPITLYTQPACVQCTAAQRRLEKAGAVVDIEEITDEVREAAKSLGVMQAPIIQFGDLTIGGFNPIAIDDMIEAQKEAA